MMGVASQVRLLGESEDSQADAALAHVIRGVGIRDRIFRSQRPASELGLQVQALSVHATVTARS